jgi:single-stranded DNA-binding protein
MNETMVCAVGNVATQPVYRELANGGSARFRLAVTARYWDREKSAWTDGHTNFFTVWANRALATNVGASVSVGDPVIVQGRLKVRNEQRDGRRWTSTRWRSATTFPAVRRRSDAPPRRGNPLRRPDRSQTGRQSRKVGPRSGHNSSRSQSE